MSPRVVFIWQGLGQHWNRRCWPWPLRIKTALVDNELTWNNTSMNLTKVHFQRCNNYFDTIFESPKLFQLEKKLSMTESCVMVWEKKFSVYLLEIQIKLRNILLFKLPEITMPLTYLPLNPLGPGVAIRHRMLLASLTHLMPLHQTDEGILAVQCWPSIPRFC